MLDNERMASPPTNLLQPDLDSADRFHFSG